MSFVGKYIELSYALNALYLKIYFKTCKWNNMNFTCNSFEITHLQYSLKLSIVNGVRMVATDMESWCLDASSSSAPAMYELVGASTSSRLNNPMNKQTNKLV